MLLTMTSKCISQVDENQGNGHYNFIGNPPQCWSKYDVQEWILWCCQEYDLSDPPLAQFSMNGKAFCMLTREDFIKRAPHAGDLLYNTLLQYINTSRLDPNNLKGWDGYPFDLSQKHSRKNVKPCNFVCCNSYNTNLDKPCVPTGSTPSQEEQPLDLSISKQINIPSPRAVGGDTLHTLDTSVTIKQETADEQYDKPLDFTVRPRREDFDNTEKPSLANTYQVESQPTAVCGNTQLPKSGSTNQMQSADFKIKSPLEQLESTSKLPCELEKHLLQPVPVHLQTDPVSRSSQNVPALSSVNILPNLLKRKPKFGTFIPQIPNLIQGIQTFSPPKLKKPSPDDHVQYRVIRTGKRGRPRKVLVQQDSNSAQVASPTKSVSQPRPPPPPLLYAGTGQTVQVKPLIDPNVKPVTERIPVRDLGLNSEGQDASNAAIDVNPKDGLAQNTALSTLSCQRQDGELTKQYNVTVQALSGGGCVILNSGFQPNTASRQLTDAFNLQQSLLEASTQVGDASKSPKSPLEVNSDVISQTVVKTEKGSDSQTPVQQQSPSSANLTSLQNTVFSFAPAAVTSFPSMQSASAVGQYMNVAQQLEQRNPSGEQFHGVKLIDTVAKSYHPIAPKLDVLAQCASKETNTISKLMSRPRKNSAGPTVFDPATNLIKVGDQNCRLLWQFLLHALMDSNYNDLIEWADKDNLVFRIKNSDALAKCWGRQKNLPNMNYEKMSRAMRFYYKSNLIGRVPGRRLLYRFLMQPEEIRRMKAGIPGRHSRALETPIEVIKETDTFSEVGSVETLPTSEADESQAETGMPEYIRDPLSPAEDTVDDSIIELSDDEIREMEEAQEYFKQERPATPDEEKI